MIVKAATWNIWAFVDHDVEAMADLIEESEIEMIGLQEVVKEGHEDTELSVSKRLADELGYNHYFCPAHDFRETDFEPERNHVMGNAVISKYPVKETHCHDLNPPETEYDGTPEKEPRIMVEAEVEVEGKTVRFLTAHLQYSHRFETTDLRKNQVGNILSRIETLEDPIVLTGDFNSPLGNEEIQMVEERLERAGSDRPTWTVHPFDYRGWEVDELKYRLDNIFVSEDVEVVSSQVLSSELSDHLPVVAELEI